MSLTVARKGFPDKNYGYILFYNFRAEIVMAVYGRDMYGLYRKLCLRGLTEEEQKAWNAKCNADLDIFLLHCDCDGKFTIEECRKVRDAMKEVSEKIDKSDDMSKEYKCLYNEWYCMFCDCVRKRVQMRFY